MNFVTFLGPMKLIVEFLVFFNIKKMIVTVFLVNSLYLACFFYYSPNRAATLKKIAVGTYSDSNIDASNSRFISD
jgi:hypothetical protein